MAINRNPYGRKIKKGQVVTFVPNLTNNYFKNPVETSISKVSKVNNSITIELCEWQEMYLATLSGHNKLEGYIFMGNLQEYNEYLSIVRRGNELIDKIKHLINDPDDSTLSKIEEMINNL